jgi:hypothetical protein
VLQRDAGETRVLAVGSVSGPQETDLRLALRTDTADVEALLEVFSEPDTATLSGAFLGRRRAGRSRRGLPLWEVDAYRRATRVAWGATAHLYPFGRAQPGQRHAVWLEIAVSREFVGGQTRPEEAVSITDSSSVRLTLEAVVRPRRAAVRLTLLRGDTASAPKVLDMVPDASGRPVTFVLGRGQARTVEVALTLPEPPRAGRDSALATNADVVCLRVLDPGSMEPARLRCGRLNNVARQIPLSDRDTWSSHSPIGGALSRPERSRHLPSSSRQDAGRLAPIITSCAPATYPCRKWPRVTMQVFGKARAFLGVTGDRT